MSKYTDVKWTSDQVQFALDSVLSKILDGDTDLTIKAESWNNKQFTIENRLTGQGRVYVNVRSGWVFMILDNTVSGSYSPKRYFWNDRPLKKTLKKLLYLLENQEELERQRKLKEEIQYKADLAQAALVNSFPEAVSRAFEKTVLGDPDGKEDKSSSNKDS